MLLHFHSYNVLKETILLNIYFGITDRKKLEKEVKDLKVQMSEYLSVRVKGARDNAS